MTTPGNLKEISTRADLSSGAAKFFNNYLQPGFTVSVNQNDAAVAFFETITNNKESARILASTVVYTAMAQQLDIASVLDNFKKMDSKELATAVVLFLNLNRVGTSFLGVSNMPSTGKYVSRMIRV